MSVLQPFWKFDSNKDNSLQQWILSNNNFWNRTYIVSLIISFLAMTFMSFFHGISGDEIDMNAYGNAILNYFITFGNDETVFNMPKEFDRDGVIQYYGGFFDLLCAIANKISPLETFTTRHLVNAWVGFLGIYFASRIAKKISNSQAAFVCVVIMFLSPFFLGHAMNNPKDIPFATAYIAAIFYIIVFFENFKQLAFKHYVSLIACIGIAINIRIAGLLLIGHFVIYAGLHLWQHRREITLLKYFMPILIVSVGSYLAGSLFWPFGLQNPIKNPWIALNQMNHFRVVIRQIFEGNRVVSNQLPWYYLPFNFYISNTFIVLAGLLLGIFFFFKKSNPKIAFLLFTAIFPLIYIIASKANVYHSWRHVLFIFPSLAIVATLGWQMLIHWFQNFKLAIAPLAMLGFLMLEPIYFIASSFPNEVNYFNGFVGGPKGAYGNYEMDYYYNSVRQTCQWFIQNELKNNTQQDTVYVASNAAHIVSEYLSPYPFVKVNYTRFLERNQQDWDYAIMHVALIPRNFVKQNTWLPPKVLYKTQLQKKTLSSVYKRPSYHDVRGFNFIQDNRLDSALYFFKLYLEKDPKNTYILNAASKILLQQSELNSAKIYADRSIALDDEDPDTQLINGIILLEQKKYGEASKLFKQVLLEFPNDEESNYYLGFAQRELKLYDEALGHLDAAAVSEKYRPSALKMMGDIYMEKNMKEEAVKLYKAAGYLK